MGRLHDQLASLDVSVTTPDEIATARLQGESSVTVSLVPGYFATSTSDRLAGKISALGALLWEARQYVVRRTLADVGLTYDESPVLSSGDAEFHLARETVKCEGRSDDESVVVSTFGMTTWAAAVEASALSGAEEDFVRAAGEAMSAALADRLPRLRELAASARAGRL